MIHNESVKITFYKIQQCGYYGWGGKAPVFGGITDTLEQLQEWSNGMELSLTKLFDLEGENQPYPVYLAGIERHGQDWVLATWNEVPAHEGGVASISRNSPVGAPEVHINEIAANSIPGYATYFWIVPSRNVIASVRFVHHISGQQQMRAYLERFLATETRYVVLAPHEEEGQVVAGYAVDGENITRTLYPKFRTVAFVKQGERDYILDNAARIKKVMRRGHLEALNVVQRRAWEGIVDFIRGRAPQAHEVAVNRSIYVEVEYTPTGAELADMIAAEDAEAANAGPWDDMGFKFQGEAKEYWLSRSTASDSFEIPVERTNEEVVDLRHLAATLDARRANILALLD